MTNSSDFTLNYVLLDPRSKITLDLFEAERYEPAVVVQPLVGNLVYFSNFGRYEPRLAKSWERTAPNKWVFHLHSNLFCENGEVITAESFKQSLIRILSRLSKRADVPILSHLKGYPGLKAGNKDLEGIEASEGRLTFHFERPIRSGLIQILSFAPFGYICSENLNSDGSWKDPSRFVSSGPYRIDTVEIGEKYVLVKNEKWSRGYLDNAPSKVSVTHSLPTSVEGNHFIVDSMSQALDTVLGMQKYPLVPEYLNAILLGNLESGYFSHIANRKWIKSLIQKHQRNLLPDAWGAHVQSTSFYPNQQRDSSTLATDEVPVNRPNEPLIIEGEEPTPGEARASAWDVLKGALEEAGISYRFAGNKMTAAAVTDQAVDIRLRGSSIGGGVEAWGLELIFCSELGIRFPDPSGRVCHLIDQYNKDQNTEEEFAEGFFRAIEEDAAILPISHFGIQIQLSENIDRSTLSPTLSILRFDQLGLLP